MRVEGAQRRRLKGIDTVILKTLVEKFNFIIVDIA